MSIVGFIKSKDGLLAFSDSKSTKNFKPEPGRENIDKIYVSDNLIIANYGQNGINGVPFEISIVNILKSNKVKTVIDFVDTFINYVKTVFGANTLFSGYFYVYEKESKKFYLLSPLDNRMGIKTTPLNETIFYLGGNEYYISCLSELLYKNSPLEYTMEENELRIKKELEYIINELDKIHFNNPCGLPIKTLKIIC